MQWKSAVVLAGLVLGVPLTQDDRWRAYPFSRETAGALPRAWRTDRTGVSLGNVWQVVEDNTAPSNNGYVLAQTSANPKAFIALCIARSTAYRNLEVSTAFKAVGGTNHRGGGLVWRFQDADNYYFVRVDSRQESIRVYKVFEGRRIELQEKRHVTVATDEWHALRVEMREDRIRCYLDKQKYLDVRDATFPGTGKVGVCTLGSAKTYFDDFKVRPR